MPQNKFNLKDVCVKFSFIILPISHILRDNVLLHYGKISSGQSKTPYAEWTHFPILTEEQYIIPCTTNLQTLERPIQSEWNLPQCSGELCMINISNMQIS